MNYAAARPGHEKTGRNIEISRVIWGTQLYFLHFWLEYYKNKKKNKIYFRRAGKRQKRKNLQPGAAGFITSASLSRIPPPGPYPKPVSRIAPLFRRTGCRYTAWFQA
jgi:hypothetical protein